ncbi:SDR family oxidoreductase [Microbacterium sp. NPDC077184]|uniref:SDR family NAD(P)-dependent oxidoreductase n=1 Tax=Microbacterium sp. NPDC077184 TaxID=3154764 RepID=UPI003419820A
MDMRLAGRVVVVTGGASGIGRACVDAFTAEGARVAVFDRQPAGSDAGTSAGEPLHVTTDVTDEDDVRRAVRVVEERLGPVDVLVGCAGVSGPVGTALSHVEAAEWDHVMAVNVRGNFLVTKHCLADLERSEVGTIVLVASDSALVAFEGMGPYTASKAAVVGLTKAITVDHPAVRANALCPGVVDTPMSRGDLGMPDGFAGTDMPVMSPHQLAAHAVFLASPVSAPINATTVVADFGMLARSALGTLDFTADASH